MAENTTIARPYARAVFEQARTETGGLARWSEALALLSNVAADATIHALITSPGLTAERKAGLFLEVIGDRLNQEGANFVKLLAENQRLPLLGDIAEVYEELRAEAEKTVDAEMISAFEVSAEQRDQFAAALGKRLARQVVLNTKVDSSLIGGAVIRAGDLVIDGSVRGKLAQLATTLH